MAISTTSTPAITRAVDTMVTRPNTTAVDCDTAAIRARRMRSANSGLS